MQNKVKPCPLCGGSVQIALMGCEMHWLSITRSGEEDSCKCRLFLQSDLLYPDATCEEVEVARQELIERWNTRKPMERIVEQLEERRNRHNELSKSEKLTDEEKLIQTRLDGCFTRAIAIVRNGGKE